MSNEMWIVEFLSDDGEYLPRLELEPSRPDDKCIARAVTPVWPDYAAAEAHANTFRQKSSDKEFRVRLLSAEEANRLVDAT